MTMDNVPHELRHIVELYNKDAFVNEILFEQCLEDVLISENLSIHLANI